MRIHRETPDRLLSRRASCALAHLGVLAFWGGLLIAAQLYPSEYDWRYMPISNLDDPGRNPTGHLWASSGILLSSLCVLCWAMELARRGNPAGVAGRPRGTRALQLGAFCMTGSAVLPQWLLRVHKGHQILALLAFTGLCLGLARLMFQTIERAFLQRVRMSNGRARLFAAILASTAALPVVIAGFVQAYVFYAVPESPWVSLSWRARGVSVFLSFAFWEWVTCVVISAYMAILPLAAGALNSTLEARTVRTTRTPNGDP